MAAADWRHEAGVFEDMVEAQQEAKEEAEADEGRRQQELEDADEGNRPMAPEKEAVDVLRFFVLDPREHSDTVSREALSL